MVMNTTILRGPAKYKCISLNGDEWDTSHSSPYKELHYVRPRMIHLLNICVLTDVSCVGGRGGQSIDTWYIIGQWAVKCNPALRWWTASTKHWYVYWINSNIRICWISLPQSNVWWRFEIDSWDCGCNPAVFSLFLSATVLRLSIYAIWIKWYSDVLWCRFYAFSVVVFSKSD